MKQHVLSPLIIVSFSFAAFLISLLFPAFSYNDFNGLKTSGSFEIFLFGSIAILGGGLMEWIIWLANPLCFIAIILFLNKKKSSVGISSAAAFIALSFLFWQDILVSESGRMASITSLHTGYYLWLFSILIVAAGTRYYFKNYKTEKAPEEKEKPGFKDHFSIQADIYSRYRPQYPDSLYSYLSSLTPEHELAWDCGTGNGQAAQGLSAYYTTVRATDPSAEQIRHAISRNNIFYIVEKAENSSLPDHSADLITIANALHWFDFDSFYAQAKRVLKKDGIIAAWGCGLPLITPEADEIIKEFHDHILGNYWLPENHLVEKKYETIPFPFESISTPDFTAVKFMNLEDLIGFINTWSAVQRFIKENHYNPTARLKVNLLKTWGDPLQEKQVRWELIMKVGKNN
jgi:SAM-dependent methyltransferase